MIYRKPDGGLEKQYRDKGGRAVWERSSMANLFTRVSIRKFQDKKIEKKDLEYILRAAMAAPSAGNQQPWEFYVTDDKMLLQELSKTSPYAGLLADAPQAIITAYRKDCKIPEYAQIDMSIAMENMWLATDEIGLGGVWLGIAPVKERMQAVEAILKLPEDQSAFGIFALGYPAEEKKQEDRYDSARVHFV